MYDAILIPGGGVRAKGELPPWTQARLDEAIQQQPCQYFILLSAGTTHKPPPLDDDGHPIFESVAAAHYLMEQGIEAPRILVETCSYDTIGNVFFSKVIHVEPLNLRKLLVITSDFHLPRTKAIFNWIYQLSREPDPYHLEFIGVPNVGIPQAVLTARIQKEQQSLTHLQGLIDSIDSLAKFHQWLFSTHQAYAIGQSAFKESGNILQSY